MTRAMILAAFGAASAFPLAAQQWAPGESCEGFLTVQSRGCFVTNFWTCGDAPEGYVYRASFDDQGPLVAGAYDIDRNWVDTVFSDGWRERLLYPLTDPISADELVERGMDAYDFETITNSEDEDLSVVRTRIRGVDLLTGNETAIDGIDLLELQYYLTYTNSAGDLYSQGRGRQYFSPEYRLFFAGEDEWDSGSGYEAYDNTPVDFIEPGEPGFGAQTPVHDCPDSVAADGDDVPLPDDDIFSLPPKVTGTKDSDGGKAK